MPHRACDISNPVKVDLEEKVGAQQRYSDFPKSQVNIFVSGLKKVPKKLWIKCPIGLEIDVFIDF